MGARRITTVSDIEVFAFVIMPVTVAALGWIAAWLVRRYTP
jgi:hypothetical protein